MICSIGACKRAKHLLFLGSWTIVQSVMHLVVSWWTAPKLPAWKGATWTATAAGASRRPRCNPGCGLVLFHHLFHLGNSSKNKHSLKLILSKTIWFDYCPFHFTNKSSEKVQKEHLRKKRVRKISDKIFTWKPSKKYTWEQNNLRETSEIQTSGKKDSIWKQDIKDIWESISETKPGGKHMQNKSVWTCWLTNKRLNTLYYIYVVVKTILRSFNLRGLKR